MIAEPIVADPATAVKLTRAELAQLTPAQARAFALAIADRAIEVTADAATTWDALRAVLGRARGRRPDWTAVYADAHGLPVPLPPPKGAAPVALHLACFYAKQALGAACYQTCDALQCEFVCDYAAQAAGAWGGTDADARAAMRSEWAMQRAEYGRLLAPVVESEAA